MQKSLIILALLTAFTTVQAQTNVDSTSGSASQSGAISGSSSAVGATNSGNNSATAIGNEAASRSQSGSNSGATSGSMSGAAGNIINLDQSVPSQQTINTTLSGTTTNNNNSTSNATVNGTSHTTVDGKTTQDLNVKNSGVVEQRASGGYTNTTNENIHYSGTQTVKNVPSIAMSGPASGPCTGASGGIGLAGPGWGLGLNGSTVMDDCRLRENTRVLGMGMQSLDGAADPQEKGEAKVMFMDAMRALAAYNATIYQRVAKENK